MEGKHTYAEAAAKLGIKESTLRHWVSKGRISHQKLGRLVRFTDEDLESAYKPVLASGAMPTARRSR